jgi:hypothetical protein
MKGDVRGRETVRDGIDGDGGLPSAVGGPVECCAFSRLAEVCARRPSVAMSRDAARTSACATCRVTLQQGSSETRETAGRSIENKGVIFLERV